MAENKDVFTILAELRRQVLGISDKNPTGMEGFLVSFLPTGQPINPDDFTNPWKPNMTTLSSAKPPTATEATPTGTDTSAIAKQYENLSNTCTLVDSKIRLNEVYQVIPSSSTISQSWEVIINGANVIKLDPTQEAYQKQQRDTYYPRLKKTITVADGSEEEVDTKEYKAYREYQLKYQKALREYAAQYMISMRTPEGASTWGVVGTTYVADVDSAWDEWVSLGHKATIEQAIDNLAAMGTDATAHMIAMAKRRFEAYRIATNGVIPVTSQYVEIFPSNWAEAGADGDGWSEYEYSSSSQTTTTESESTSFSASGKISVGFWSAGADVSYEHAEQHNEMVADGLELKLKFGILNINRPFLDTIVLEMGNWFLVGNHPKGSISKGTMDQVLPENGNATAWLPLIPKQIFVIKDLWIKTNHIEEHFDSLTERTSGGGSFGIGPFSLGGKYNHTLGSTSLVATKEAGGYRVSGTQIQGWISEITAFSPKVDAPAEVVP